MERRGARPTPPAVRLRQNSSKPNPSQTKKMSLDSLGFLRSILGFSIGYGRSKQKNIPPKAEPRRRPAANILRGRSPEATGLNSRRRGFSPCPAQRGPPRIDPRAYAVRAFSPILCNFPQLHGLTALAGAS